MPDQPRILVIEDEPPLQKLLRVTLAASGYQVIESATAANALIQAATIQPELVILDLGLPDMDGLEVIRQIREWSSMPIIVVTARGKEQDKVVALDAGADDYLTKPFSVAELLARVRVVLRHLATLKPGSAITQIRFGKIEIDLGKREVLRAGERLQLTPTEYRLLTTLVKNSGKVMTHAQLLKEVWGPGSTHEHHYVRVFMNQIRQKIEDDPGSPRHLLTETGVGYRFDDTDS
jgi:two-component system KDP operon response regulator KdpE